MHFPFSVVASSVLFENHIWITLTENVFGSYLVTGIELIFIRH